MKLMKERSSKRQIKNEKNRKENTECKKKGKREKMILKKKQNRERSGLIKIEKKFLKMTGESRLKIKIRKKRERRV
jgi:hypothetical protein